MGEFVGLMNLADSLAKDRWKGRVN